MLEPVAHRLPARTVRRLASAPLLLVAVPIVKYEQMVIVDVHHGVTVDMQNYYYQTLCLCACLPLMGEMGGRVKSRVPLESTGRAASRGGPRRSEKEPATHARAARTEKE
jgi:hypothetical protein